ncbi:MAG: VWA domain-containing protein [Deltaproteobacteria bacterium]|nr:VWA domain-containing protein [Deltaproteobacteria bacterium]
MKFQYLWILHLLWLIPFFAIFFVVDRRRKWLALSKYADPALLERLAPPLNHRKVVFKAILMLAAVGFIIFSLAGPQWGSHYREVSGKGVDIAVVLDVSRSMLARDVKPNRLERAKREILDLLKVMQGDRVALVTFAGAAFVEYPLTLDYAAMELFINGVSPDQSPVPGTDLGQAVRKAMDCFDFKSETDKAVILVTDGEDQEGRGVEEAKEAASKGVRLFIIGMGAPEGAPIPRGGDESGFEKDAQGNLILSKLVEPGLIKMAAATGGGYTRSVTGDLDLDSIYFQGLRAKTEKKELKGGKVRVYEERFHLFAVLALAFLLTEGLVRERTPA